MCVAIVLTESTKIKNRTPDLVASFVLLDLLLIQYPPVVLLAQNPPTRDKTMLHSQHAWIGQNVMLRKKDHLQRHQAIVCAVAVTMDNIKVSMITKEQRVCLGVLVMLVKADQYQLYQAIVSAVIVKVENINRPMITKEIRAQCVMQDITMKQ